MGRFTSVIVPVATKVKKTEPGKKPTVMRQSAFKYLQDIRAGKVITFAIEKDARSFCKQLRKICEDGFVLAHKIYTDPFKPVKWLVYDPSKQKEVSNDNE